MKKELGYVGLGKMGYGMVERLLEKGYSVTVFDRNEQAVNALVAKGAKKATSLPELAQTMSSPKTVWVMVPHTAVDSVLQELTPYLSASDVVIDGGNSPYLDSIRRAQQLETSSISFIDVGVSGGPSGARNGACLMVGGKRELYDAYEELFRDIAHDTAYAYMGASGSGHFVKMVHNGIEYGMMQSLAEGFSLLKNSEFSLSLKEVARVYNTESVITSRLTDWLLRAYDVYGDALEDVSGEVGSTGEGAWTVEVAHRLQVPVPAIESALHFREASQGNPSYTGKVLSALRNQFGGHSLS